MITVETLVNAPVEHAWKIWTEPEHIMGWNFASDDWECPAAENDLRVGGRFTATMAAKDGSASFVFGGTYDVMEPYRMIAYKMDGEDARKVEVSFEEIDGMTKVVERFDPENENPEEMQRAGWQAILDNFKAYAETTA